MQKTNQHRSNLAGARALVLFDKGRTVPRSDSGLLLALVGERLTREPTARVQLIGHANLREYPRSAELLGFKRAANVASALVAFGAQIEQLHVTSAGVRTPAMTPTGRAEPSLCRRVEIYWG